MASIALIILGVLVMVASWFQLATAQPESAVAGFIIGIGLFFFAGYYA